MLPEEREYFENGDVTLEVHHLGDGSTTYWIKGGVGFLEFKEEELCSLAELLSAYKKEEIEGKTSLLVGIYYVSNIIIVLVLLTVISILILGDA